MTTTSDRALIRRISSISDGSSWLEMIQEMAKKTGLSSEVLDAIDQKTLSIGESAGWYLVTPYLVEHGRSGLYDELCKRVLPDGYEAAELFRSGYGDVDAEQRLCDCLYQIYLDDANPLRSEILKAMAARGGRRSVDVLEVIVYELDPRVKSRGVVAQALDQSPMLTDEYLLVVSLRSANEFLQRAKKTIEEIELRLSREEPVDSQQAHVWTPEADSDGQHKTTLIPHARRNSVTFYLDKASTLIEQGHSPEALNNMRKACEAILKDLIDESRSDVKGDGKDARPSDAFKGFEDLIAQARRRKIIQLQVDKYFDALQSFGNFASHDQDIDPATFDNVMAKAAMILMNAVVEWYGSTGPAQQVNPGQPAV